MTIDAMDRELDRAYVRQRRMRRLAVLAVVVGGVVTLFALLPGWLRPSLRRGEIRTGTVDRGPVEGGIEASGTVVPAFEKVLSSPVEARVVRILKRPGERIEEGDEILELDTAASRLELARLEDLLAQKRNQREQLRLDLEDELAALASTIESRKLDLQIVHYRRDQSDKLFAEGLVAEEAVRQSEVEAKKAEIELRQLEESLGRTRHTHAARLEAVDLDLRILAGQRDAAARELELATTRADRRGVVTWVVPEEGATVRRGEVIARIADLDAYRVEGAVSDVHAARLAAGQPVHVRLDGETLDGTLAGVHPQIDNGVVRFDVELAEPSHPKLRSNLRVDLLVVTGRRAAVLRLPRASFAEGGGTATVFVVEGDRAVRRRITLGLTGDDYEEITEGLEEGDEVILSDMTDYRHLETIDIED